MRRLFFVCAVASLLVAVGSMAWAGTINTSKSNTFRLAYDTTAVSPAQAAAVLKELDKIGPGATEATVRKLLQKQGVNLSLIKLIRIVPAGQRRGGEKIPLILILTNPADEPAALAVSDPGAPGEKTKK
jgi:hypothetical protein